MASEESTGNNKLGTLIEMLLCCNVVKAETKHSKIDGVLKNVLSVKVAVKPRDPKVSS